MNDERVDELLKDLDAALAVELSPAVVASVRTRIAERTSSGWLSWRWSLAGVTGLAAVGVVSAYLIWPRVGQLPVVGLTMIPETGGGIPPPPPPASVERTPGGAHAPRVQAPKVKAAQIVAPVDVEPEVIISPSVRIALDQLAAAVRAGRIAEDPALAERNITLPAPIVIEKMTIAKFKVDPAPPGVVPKDVR